MTELLSYVGALLIFAISMFFLSGSISFAGWVTMAMWMGSIVLCVTAKKMARQ